LIGIFCVSEMVLIVTVLASLGLAIPLTS